MSTPERLACALLLFYSEGQWSDDKRQEWFALTGEHEATTKVLGDLARRLIAELEGTP